MQQHESNLSPSSRKRSEIMRSNGIPTSSGAVGDGYFATKKCYNPSIMKGIPSKSSRIELVSNGDYTFTGVSSASSPRISRSGSFSHLPINGCFSRGGDKTICEYCGLSYLTISEMRALQTKVKDQDERLNQLKEAVSENTVLKETLASLRKTHRKEVTKREEECQKWMARCTNVEKGMEAMKRELKDFQTKNSDIIQKLGIASEDSKQQEDMICQLRRKLQSIEGAEAEVIAMKGRNKQLEDSLSKILQENKRLKSSISETSNTAKTDVPTFLVSQSQEAFPGEIALKAKIAQLTEQCSRLEEKNALLTEELAAKPDELKTNSSSGSNNPARLKKSHAKVPSVVTVEVHDLKRENAILSSRLQAMSDEHSNCQDMHSFLRESIEKLKSDNSRLLEDINGVKVKYEESLLKVENFQAVISGYQAERNRFLTSYKDQQTKMEQMAAQNKAFHKSCDPRLIDRLRNNISSLERQIQSIQSEKDRQQLEFEGKIAEGQREVQMEKERADSYLTQSLKERDEVEQRWQERWTRHHSKLNDQLEILKTNYEGSLKCAKEREEGLQKDIKVLEEKNKKNQDEWEDCKASLNQEIIEWKVKFDELEQELQNTVKGKVDVEVMFQEKSQQLEELHEAVRQGCEERQDLKRRTEELERNIQESVFTGISASAMGFDLPPSKLVDSCGDVPQEFEYAVKPSEIPIEVTSSAAEASVASWKLSQNVNGLKLTPLKAVVPKQVKLENTNLLQHPASPHARQRPNSPFPLLCRKSSVQTFSIGNGKLSKSNAHVHFKDVVKNAQKTSGNGVTFSVAPPVIQSRKPPRH